MTNRTSSTPSSQVITCIINLLASRNGALKKGTNSMQPALDRGFQGPSSQNQQQIPNQATSMMPGFIGSSNLYSPIATDGKKRSREAPEPAGIRRITTRLEGAADDDMMMQIDQEEKKEEEGNSEFKRTKSNTYSAMSMRPKTVGAQDLMAFKGLQAKPKPPKNIRPPEMDRGTEINKAGEVDE